MTDFRVMSDELLLTTFNDLCYRTNGGPGCLAGGEGRGPAAHEGEALMGRSKVFSWARDYTFSPYRFMQCGWLCNKWAVYAYPHMTWESRVSPVYATLAEAVAYRRSMRRHL